MTTSRRFKCVPQILNLEEAICDNSKSKLRNVIAFMVIDSTEEIKIEFCLNSC